MKVTICAVGRMRAGPEIDLVSDYAKRFDRTGRPLGFGPLSVSEVEDKKGGGMSGEAALLRRSLPADAICVVLDERGKIESSISFAERMSDWRDTGVRDLAFVIGGADGIDPLLRAEAHHALSFGKMVWPHMLVRVMLCEQLYRAVSILAGSPYHRE